MTTAAASSEHERWMRRALGLARASAASGEVPVGAVVVLDGEVIGESGNRPVAATDPTAHAEVLALRAAARKLGNYRMPGAILYVTVEPCTMCAGALVHARVATLVFGCTEPRAGAVVSTAAVLDNPGLNHRVAVMGGVLADESAALVRAFFASRRGERDATAAEADSKRKP